MALIRLRKYRIFLAVAVCCLLVVYYVGREAPEYSSGSWRGFGKHPAGPEPPTVPPSHDASAHAGTPSPHEAPHHEVPVDAETPPPAFGPIANGNSPPATEPDDADDEDDDTDSDADDSTRAHWTTKADTYPVPTASSIILPSGTPKAIPKIQHEFAPETSAEKSARLKKLNAIKASMKRTWTGYKQHAWMKDELKPESGGHNEHYNGWGATLVDSLDTLWIMGMTKEFEQAVDAVRKIDFTTSRSSTLPLFETTIRYLGGLLGAYDVSGNKYHVLRDQAEELGDVLMGAFDTPNRMPLLRYNWEGSRDSNAVDAPANAVLAELGTLSLEFTRLAQVTGNSKYYDAVARVTNALAEYQNRTQLPGLWPLSIDTSDCYPEDDDNEPDYIDYTPPKDTTSIGGDKSAAGTEAKKKLTAEELRNLKDKSSFGEPAGTGARKKPTADKLRLKDKTSFGQDRPTTAKRQEHSQDDGDSDSADDNDDADADVDDEVDDDEADDGSSDDAEADDGSSDDADTTPPKSHCLAQLTGAYNSQFSIGGEGDSTYEYLAKEYLLLGGLNDQYAHMYSAAAEAIKENLMYRPMIDDEKRELLFTGKFFAENRVNSGQSSKAAKGNLDPAVGHLSCFQGAMFALGAKIFNRPADLKIGSKMTDACVWAYEKSASGIMPDDITPVPCSHIDKCSWNQTAWWLAIDPQAATRPTTTQRDLPNTDNTRRSPEVAHELNGKRQMDEKTKLKETHLSGTDQPPPQTNPKPHPIRPKLPKGHENPNKKDHDLTHEEYVQKAIKVGGFWPGIRKISSDKYILRPEAIESVWYMYRITGDESWRQKGWAMFQAVEAGTKTKFGNSAISEVSSSSPRILDEAESFWTAETLKYFYLLFSTPDVICLDDYVLNTEAHPFLRPSVEEKT